MSGLDTGTVQYSTAHYSTGQFVFCVPMELGAQVVIRDLVSKWVILGQSWSFLFLCLFVAHHRRQKIAAIDGGRNEHPLYHGCWLNFQSLIFVNLYLRNIRSVYVWTGRSRFLILLIFSFPEIETFLIVITRSTGAIFFTVHCRYKNSMLWKSNRVLGNNTYFEKGAWTLHKVAEFGPYGFYGEWEYWFWCAYR
jgi:hypothetical protein